MNHGFSGFQLGNSCTCACHATDKIIAHFDATKNLQLDKNFEGHVDHSDTKICS